MGPSVLTREGDSRPRSGFSLLLAGAGFFGRACVGRARLTVPRRVFARAVLRSVRPHYFAFPAAAALSGAAWARPSGHALAIAAAALSVGVAWGVGQLLNDLVDVDADAVDAPDRPAVTGELPAAPAAAVAMLLGLMVAVALGCLHPAGYQLVALSAGLLLLYPLAKPWVGLGNLAHGALMAVVSVIGFAAARPGLALADVARVAWPVALVTGLTAALYLQANYEKDRVGDARAGYRTLAHVLGVRGSALLRGALVIGIALIAMHLGLTPTPSSFALMAGASLLVGLSVSHSLLGHEASGPLTGYRWAIHGTSALLLAPAAPMLGSAATLAMLAVAVILVERAFRRSPNP
jgi:4-hydroxybenzoate polyprenyltransferase